MGIMVFMNCKRLKRTPGADRCNIETLLSRPRILRRSHWTLCALAGGYIAASAQAAMMTTIKFQPNSADTNDLDHRLAIHGGSMVSARAAFAVTGSTLSVGTVSRGMPIRDAGAERSQILESTLAQVRVRMRPFSIRRSGGRFPFAGCMTDRNSNRGTALQITKQKYGLSIRRPLQEFDRPKRCQCERHSSTSQLGRPESYDLIDSSRATQTPDRPTFRAQFTE